MKQPESPKKSVIRNCYENCHFMYSPVKPCGYFNAQYYPSGAIRHFCRAEMMFLLSWLEYLESGRYPRPQSGYTDAEKTYTPVFIAGAYFQTPIELAAEVRIRLDRTKEDGQTLLWECVHGKDEQDIAYRDLAPAAKRALAYICGHGRKHLTYRAWKMQKIYRSGQPLNNK